MIKPWRWRDDGATRFILGKWTLLDGRGRERATIWQNAGGPPGRERFTLHTWDENGVGGENFEATSLDDAKRHCVASIVLQGWAPGGWTVQR